jgi:L,D-transpeptidase ErfK/SrfK
MKNPCFLSPKMFILKRNKRKGIAGFMNLIAFFRSACRIVACQVIFMGALQATVAAAPAYSFDARETVVGSVREHTAGPDESLIEIARNFGLGYNEIVEANPGLDAFVPGTGRKVVIPTSWVLPDVPYYNGIVINLPELRLYYFFDQGSSHYVVTFPIGIGREGWETPEGDFTVVEKIEHPAWHVPESIREQEPDLPDVVPPGPDNPLGSHALRLSLRDVLIHGTNKPWGVGRRVSHGCIRLYPEDIPILFAMVPNGAKVIIVRQPIKVGVREGRIYIEAHKDDSADTADKAKEGCIEEAVKELAEKKLMPRVSATKLYTALKQRLGVPVDITE